jgi:hypothetical protein
VKLRVMVSSTPSSLSCSQQVSLHMQYRTCVQFGVRAILRCASSSTLLSLILMNVNTRDSLSNTGRVFAMWCVLGFAARCCVDLTIAHDCNLGKA